MKRMLLTTLCYIEKGDQYLMLHRVKKEHDINKDKWIGVGGKFEDKKVRRIVCFGKYVKKPD